MTKNPGTRASSAMMSSARPVAISSSARSSDRFSNGRTAIDGRSAMSGGSRSALWPSVGPRGLLAGRHRRTVTPLRAIVRIRRCSLPLSPRALRAALMRLSSVESETMRPPQTEAMRSSLLTTRSRFSIEIDQKVEHLRLDRNNYVTRAQLAAFAVEHEILERKQHVVAPHCWPTNYTGWIV